MLELIQIDVRRVDLGSFPAPKCLQLGL
jgi:hypothetical protein